jgi:hypothetical protein
MGKYCQGSQDCNAKQFCGCLPEGVKAVASTTTKCIFWKVEWNGMVAAHCRTPKQALAKARKLNKKNETNCNYVAVRVATTTKTEVLIDAKDKLAVLKHNRILVDTVLRGGGLFSEDEVDEMMTEIDKKIVQEEQKNETEITTK